MNNNNKYMKLVIEPDRLPVDIVGKLLRGEKVIINLNPPRSDNENAPLFHGKGFGCWIKESHFSNEYQEGTSD